ncbi:hypothetical protein EV208_12118 [Christensenella hongkongensis]|nr:hypothetical protein EV208_12118 [Christensenella hongkongensis]
MLANVLHHFPSRHMPKGIYSVNIITCAGKPFKQCRNGNHCERGITMLNKEVLECLEQNIEGAQKIAYYMNDGEGLSVQELMLDIKVDHFQGYEFLLAIMLLVTDDSAIERTRNRLFIRWFRKELEAKGAAQTVERIANILSEENLYFETKRKRLIELDKQNKL